LESAVEAFEMAGKTKDDEGKLVIKVVLETGEDE
jgi:L-iditol 2-dehydrogenase